jgi:hypothetical protein
MNGPISAAKEGLSCVVAADPIARIRPLHAAVFPDAVRDPAVAEGSPLNAKKSPVVFA